VTNEKERSGAFQSLLFSGRLSAFYLDSHAGA
jgi:hypothetical protein